MKRTPFHRVSKFCPILTIKYVAYLKAKLATFVKRMMYGNVPAISCRYEHRVVLACLPIIAECFSESESRGKG